MATEVVIATVVKDGENAVVMTTVVVMTKVVQDADNQTKTKPTTENRVLKGLKQLFFSKFTAAFYDPISYSWLLPMD